MSRKSGPIYLSPKDANKIREQIAKVAGMKVDPKAIVAYEYVKDRRKKYALLYTDNRLEVYGSAEDRDKHVGLAHNRYPRKTQYI